MHVEQGTTFSLTVLWQHADGSPQSVAGCTARSQARDGATLLWDLSSEAEIALTDGVVSIEVSPTLTRALPDAVSRHARYDLEIYYADGRIVRLLEGGFFVDPEVTVE